MHSIKFIVVCAVLITFLVEKSYCYAISDRSKLENLEHKLDILLNTESEESSLLQKLVDNVNDQGNHGPTTPAVPTVSIPVKESENIKKVEVEDALVSVSEQKITSADLLSQLTANSKRMESMVVLIVDLQSALSQAVSAQEKQMALRTEVVELREEVDSLRQEIKSLKSQEATNQESRLTSHLANKIHNDETTIQWLKDSYAQLRHELTEVSSSINFTGLFQVKEDLKIHSQLTSSNIENLQNQVQTIQSNQAQTSEDLLEIRGDIAEVRTQQANIGIENVNEIEPKIREITDFQSELHGLILKEQSKKSYSSTKRHGHESKKLKTELRALENLVQKLSLDQKFLHRNFRKLQFSQKPNIRNKRNSQEYGSTSETYRLTTLEKAFTDHTQTLDTLDKKITSLEQLKDSTKSMFNVMEAIETKYDGKLSEIQTTLGRMEKNHNQVSLLTDDLKEEQNNFSRQLKSISKDLRNEKEQNQKNYLRIASMQSQVVKLGLQNCISEDANLIEKIQA